MINIKVDGITDLKQLKQLDGLDIEFAGLDFTNNSLKDTLNGDEIKDADLDLRKVGIFEDAEYDAIIDMVDEFSLDAIQLNGNESPELCEELSENLEVIKSFTVTDKDSIQDMIADYDEVCDYYLFQFDGKTSSWDLLKDVKIEKPFFIGSAVSLDDSEKIKSYDHPDFFGVNIDEHFDKSPGLKDMVMVLQFKKALKK